MAQSARHVISRYGVDGTTYVRIADACGERRVVAKSSASYQSVSLGQLGRWLWVSKDTRVMGEHETDLIALDPVTLEQVFWTRFDRADLCGSDGEGRLVIGTYYPAAARDRPQYDYRAWDIASWTRDEAFVAPRATLAPLPVDSVGPLVTLAPASPLGRWNFSTRLGDGPARPGTVVAGPNEVIIEQHYPGGRSFQRRLAGHASIEGNRGQWDGEYGGEPYVTVRIDALNDTEAVFCWRDGVTYDEHHRLTR